MAPTPSRQSLYHTILFSFFWALAVIWNYLNSLISLRRPCRHLSFWTNELKLRPPKGSLIHSDLTKDLTLIHVTRKHSSTEIKKQLSSIYWYPSTGLPVASGYGSCPGTAHISNELCSKETMLCKLAHKGAFSSEYSTTVLWNVNSK